MSTSSISSRITKTQIDGKVFCDCGLESQVVTSWTPEHPGLRFHGCPNWKDKSKRCGFFHWIDQLPEKGKIDHFPEKARQVINNERRENRELKLKLKDVETELLECQQGNRKLKDQTMSLKLEIERLEELYAQAVEEKFEAKKLLNAAKRKEKVYKWLLVTFVFALYAILVMSNQKTVDKLMLMP